MLSKADPFDRGFYAGPFGWLSGSSAEFVVAIRSALLQVDHSLESISTQAGHRLSRHPTFGASASRDTVGDCLANQVILDDLSAHHNFAAGSEISASMADERRASSDAAGFSGRALDSVAGGSNYHGTVHKELNCLLLYAGVGIVPGSIADSEWQV